MVYFHRYYFRIALLLTFGFLLVTSFVLYLRLGAFGCFDECPNYAVGYFLSQGRQLYSQIFFNHQPLLPVISYLLQYFDNPQSLYELVRLHRTFVIVFSFSMNMLLIWRFGWVGIGFSLLYESTKFYSMGSLFLGESLSVYLYVYAFLAIWQRWQGRPHKTIDSILVPCMIWAGIFLREPYIPLAGFLFLSYVLVAKKHIKVSLTIFAALTLITLWQLPLRDYWFAVVTANAQALVLPEIQKMGTGGFGIVKPFVYPVLVWFGGVWNIYRLIECGVSLGLLSLGFVLFRGKKNIRLFLFWLCIVLGLGALRYVPAGTMYYEAFHLLPWWGLMLAAVCVLSYEYWTTNANNVRKVLVVWYFILLGILIFSPKSFYWERFDTKAEFATGYARYSLNSEAIKAISTPSHTLFLDVWDDVLYVTTKLKPAYTFSWYTPVMGSFEKYTDARVEMFATHPPDFYYYSCENHQAIVPIGPDIQALYTRLQKDGTPSCIFVLKSVLSSVSIPQRDALSRLGFSIPL